MTTAAIQKAIAARKELNARGEVIHTEHNLIKKSLAAPNSKAKAIGAFCFSCYGGTEDEMPDPGWKNMIRTCSSFNCPLYGHRPYR